MALFSVPVTNQPNQQFSIIMPINGVNTPYNVRLRYNEAAGYWVLTLANKAGAVLVDGLPLVPGDPPAANIIGQLAHLGIGGIALVKQGKTAMDYPDDTALGNIFALVWGDLSEFA